MTLRVGLSRYQHPLRGGSKSPHLIVEQRAGILLTLDSEPGLFGQGEAAPLPGYSDESLEDAERALKRLDPVRVARLSELVDKSAWGSALERELESSVPRSISSARYALESALFDLSARRSGRALHALLRAQILGTSSLIEPIEPIERAALVDLGPGLSEAEAALAVGFRTLKVKLGAPGRFAEEHARLSELRVRAGPDFSLRLDANQSFPLQNAAEYLKALRELDIEFIEEPTRAGARWVEAPALGVALDESLRTEPALSEDLVRRYGLVALVLKPSVLGGLLGCLRLARNARELGLAVIVSHTFEGPVGFATLLELALALGPLRFAHGLGPHRGLGAWRQAPELAEPLPRWSAHPRSGNGISRLVIGLDESAC